MRTKAQKAEFIATATPMEIYTEYPSEYTLVNRMGIYKWHLSVVPRTRLERLTYELASLIRSVNLEHKIPIA